MKIFKWISRLILCAAVIWILAGVLNYYLNKPNSPPKIADAPFIIQTYSNDEFRIPSRIYYTGEINYNPDGTPTAKVYWSYDGKNYKKHSGSIEFPVSIYGNIDIIRRD